MAIQKEKMGINVSVSKVVEEYTWLCEWHIGKGKRLKDLPAFFLWGPPGVGKSAAVRQIAERLQIQTKKQVNVTDIRLLLFSPIDLRGVPVADQNKEFTKWLMPKLFDMDAADDVINLLFLDELSAAPPAVQAAAYQITLDRRVGEHVLPDNCAVIAAGNRTTDRSVAYRMPMALANRLIHFEVEADFESFQKWAIMHDVHPFVLGYLSQDRTKLCLEDVPLDQMAFPTPRSWMFVSDILTSMPEGFDMEALYPMLSGCIGQGQALEFITWCKQYGMLPDVNKIFLGKETTYPKTMDGIYNVIQAILQAAILREKNGQDAETGGISKMELEHVCQYADRFPEDYKSCLYVGLANQAGLKWKLTGIPSFMKWLSASAYNRVSVDTRDMEG